MKAITRTGYVSSTLGFSETHPVPEFDPNVTNADEVLISVKAASINPIDYKLNPMAKLAFDIVGKSELLSIYRFKTYFLLLTFTSWI